MASSKPAPVDLTRVKTISIKTRKHKTRIQDFARVSAPPESFAQFLSSWPNILKASDFLTVVDAIVAARRQKRTILLALGDSVIKVGLSPLVIEWMRRGLVSGIALQGAGIIHDAEVALIGETSEEVADTIRTGVFGMAEETGKFLNLAIRRGASENLGIGEAVGRALVEQKVPHLEHSLVAQAYQHQIPVTVHVAIGTDTIHMHPLADGAALGQGSHLDFKTFAGLVATLENGVILNIGSAVILPEVFLKALSVARNLGHAVERFTSVNMDMIQHYRPTENVVKRPTQDGGQGYQLIGHHEIMFPLLTRAILEKLA